MAGYWGNIGTGPLFVLRSANLQSTADQAFVKQRGFTLYMPRRICARVRTGGATVACAGGIYTAASKGGDALVAVGQSWVTLSAAGKSLDATIAAVALSDTHSQTPYLSLTTGSTAACTADIFIFGDIID